MVSLTLLALAPLAAVNAPPASAAVPVTPGQARAAQWWLTSLGVSAAQRVSTGEGVRICLIDNGVDPAFPDLDGARFVDGTDQSGTGAADGLKPVASGIEGHGTAMAAYLAGQGRASNRSSGLLGVAPGAQIISVSVADSASTSPLEDAVAYCADHGAGVINLSMTGSLDPRAVAYAQARDVVIVAGAGNFGARDSIGGIAQNWGVLAVGGVDQNLVIDPRSNASGPILFDPSGDPLPDDTGGVAVMGPYARTAATDPTGCRGGFYGPAYRWAAGAGDYALTCGTSVATAVVSGVAALVRAAHPELNAANVINRIVTTATAPTDGSRTPSPLYGFGTVNADAAVTGDVPTLEDNPLGSCYTGGRGVWDDRVRPTRSEPAAHATLPAGRWQDEPATPTEPSSSADGPGRPATAAGIPTIAVLLGALALTTLVVGGAGVVLLTRRRPSPTAPAPPATPPQRPGDGAAPPH